VRRIIVALVLGIVVAAITGGAALAVPLVDLDTLRPSDDRSASNARSGTPDSSQLLEKAQREGSVRVIVRLRTDFAPEGSISRSEVAAQRTGIESTQAGLQAALQGTGYRTLREYDTVPYIALELSSQALQAVQSSPLVRDIRKDRLEKPALKESVALVQAPTMWANGYTGSGQVVAVLDSGVASTHPFLAGKVVEEACYTADRVAGSGFCPNGTATQVGAGSAVPCTYAPSQCDHGTHVAGIAAGRGSDFSGVAKDANIMAVQVFSKFTGAAVCGAPPRPDPCARTYQSDQLAGLERVYSLRTSRNFSSVNMSLGGGKHTNPCDTDPRKAAIDNLRSAGIATVISSGNEGYTDATGAPGCISSAITVGSTTKSDTISSFSNSAEWVDLLAPGSDINSSVPGGGFALKSGTSMAAPHVAGAWALLKQKTPSATVTSLETSLESTGLPVTDNRVAGGLTKPRIRIADAAGIKPPPPDEPPKVVSTTPADMAKGVARGANITATFSEPMKESSVNTTTFKLQKKAGPTIAATVTYDPATKKATLNPNNKLKKSGAYVATVTSGAQDQAGNSLDQDPSSPGNQDKRWTFKVRR
jgi:subtilisin